MMRVRISKNFELTELSSGLFNLCFNGFEMQSVVVLTDEDLMKLKTDIEVALLNRHDKDGNYKEEENGYRR